MKQSADSRPGGTERDPRRGLTLAPRLARRRSSESPGRAPRAEHPAPEVRLARGRLEELERALGGILEALEGAHGGAPALGISGGDVERVCGFAGDVIEGLRELEDRLAAATARERAAG